MIFTTLTGGKRKCSSPQKYLIDWKGGSRSQFQQEVKKFLYRYWYNHVVFEEFPIVGTRMTLDIFNATDKIAIEVQGQQHFSFNKFFHNKSLFNFRKQLRRDVDKEIFCERNNIQLVTILPKDSGNLSIQLFKELGVTLN